MAAKPRKTRPEEFILQPEYPGGEKAMVQFIHENLKYPKEAEANKIQGIVRVRLHINSSGIVTKVQTISKLGFGCEEEAIRICSQLKFLVDKRQVGKILYHKNLRIQFKLPVKPSQEVSQQNPVQAPTIQYVYTTNSKPVVTPLPTKKPTGGGGYEITITFDPSTK